MIVGRTGILTIPLVAPCPPVKNGTEHAACVAGFRFCARVERARGAVGARDAAMQLALLIAAPPWDPTEKKR